MYVDEDTGERSGHDGHVEPGRVAHVENPAHEVQEPRKRGGLTVPRERDIAYGVGPAPEPCEGIGQLREDVGPRDRGTARLPLESLPVDHLAVHAVEVAGLLRIEVDAHREAPGPPRPHHVHVAVLAMAAGVKRRKVSVRHAAILARGV